MVVNGLLRNNKSHSEGLLRMIPRTSDWSPFRIGCFGASCVHAGVRECAEIRCRERLTLGRTVLSATCRQCSLGVSPMLHSKFMVVLVELVTCALFLIPEILGVSMFGKRTRIWLDVVACMQRNNQIGRLLSLKQPHQPRIPSEEMIYHGAIQLKAVALQDSCRYGWRRSSVGL